MASRVAQFILLKNRFVWVDNSVHWSISELILLTMNYAGSAVEAPFLKDIALAAIAEFLKKRTDYLFNIGNRWTMIARLFLHLLLPRPTYWPLSVRLSWILLLMNWKIKSYNSIWRGFLQALRESSAGRWRNILRDQVWSVDQEPYFSCFRSF